MHASLTQVRTTLARQSAGTLAGAPPPPNNTLSIVCRDDVVVELRRLLLAVAQVAGESSDVVFYCVGGKCPLATFYNNAFDLRDARIVTAVNFSLFRIDLASETHLGADAVGAVRTKLVQLMDGVDWSAANALERPESERKPTAQVAELFGALGSTEPDTDGRLRTFAERVGYLMVKPRACARCVSVYIYSHITDGRIVQRTCVYTKVCRARIRTIISFNTAYS